MSDYQLQMAAGPGQSAVRELAPIPERTAARQRRGAVREMLASLEHATAAGQHHLMRKVVGVLNQEASSSEVWLSETQRRSIASSLAALAREAARIAPDAVTFVRGAVQIVDALSGVA